MEMLAGRGGRERFAGNTALPTRSNYFFGFFGFCGVAGEAWVVRGALANSWAWRWGALAAGANPRAGLEPLGGRRSMVGVRIFGGLGSFRFHDGR